MSAPTYQRRFGEIRVVAEEASGDLCFRHVTSSTDARLEASRMANFLELERAARLRNVTIEPHEIGGLIVFSPSSSLWSLIRAWFRARLAMRKAMIAMNERLL